MRLVQIEMSWILIITHYTANLNVFGIIDKSLISANLPFLGGYNNYRSGEKESILGRPSSLDHRGSRVVCSFFWVGPPH